MRLGHRRCCPALDPFASAHHIRARRESKRPARHDRYAAGRRARRVRRPGVDAATGWIQRQGGKWFAWVHVYDPHAPYQPPAPFDRQYADAPYAGEVAYTDHALGPLFDLARSGARPTFIVVTADHGEALG